jgi:hypothetical protein
MLIAASANAQLRRTPGPDGGPPAGEAKGIPRIGARPYAGVWDGTFTIKGGPGGENRIPVVMVFAVTDSAAGTYDGFTVLPNGARAPHLATGVAGGAIHWRQTNSGGGFWIYAGKIVSQDSIAGTVALKDWPQLPPGEKPPTGTFELVRRKPGA